MIITSVFHYHGMIIVFHPRFTIRFSRLLSIDITAPEPFYYPLIDDGLIVLEEMKAERVGMCIWVGSSNSINNS